MISKAATVAVVSIQPVARQVTVEGVEVTATVPTLVAELVDADGNGSYLRIPAPSAEQIAECVEGATVEIAYSFTPPEEE